ncbi:MAG: LytTR family DNA-binding domain-containing protein [Bacteroidota bacterium]
MAESLRILVVDDEPLARQRVLDLLDADTEAEVVGTAASGREAIERIREGGVDLVFLDVQMPGLTGLDVVREIGPANMPATIFATAYDQHALDAFDVHAIDYLLKPFEDERFRQALARARERIRLREVDGLRERLLSLLGGTPASVPSRDTPETPRYAERLAVEMRGQIRVVPVEEVDVIQADGAYAEIHAGDAVYVVRERMQALEARLDPAQFMRIHRSTIVRLDRVEALLTAPGGDYAVRLSNGRKLRVSRSRRDDLAARLGMDGS